MKGDIPNSSPEFGNEMTFVRTEYAYVIPSLTTQALVCLSNVVNGQEMRPVGLLAPLDGGKGNITGYGEESAGSEVK